MIKMHLYLVSYLSKATLEHPATIQYLSRVKHKTLLYRFIPLFKATAIQRGAKYKPNARACGGIPAASQLWPTQWRQWEIANKNRVYCPVYWSCCINISLQFPNVFSHTSASMKDIQLSITFLLAILSITIHHWVNLFPFLLWAIGWKLHTHKRLMWKNDEIRAYCSWLTDSFT